MKKIFWVFAAILFLGGLSGVARVYAEDPAGSVPLSLKEQLDADKQKVQEQKQEMKTDSEAAKMEEKDLKAQIKTAREAGDKQKVAELEKQLKTTQHENVQEGKEYNKELKGAKKELRKDAKVARRTRR